MMSLTFGLFTKVSSSGPLGPLVCGRGQCNLDQAVFKLYGYISMFSTIFLQRETTFMTLLTSLKK